MDRETMLESMRVAISNVLETMFFEPVQISENNCTLQEWFSDKQSLLGATLDFTGSSSGACFLLIPSDLAGEITANFLGLAVQETDEEQKRDTIKEALNMIGGHMFSIFDNVGSINLGIPELIEENSLTHYKLGDMKGDTVFIDTGDNRLAAGIMTEIK